MVFPLINMYSVILKWHEAINKVQLSYRVM